MKEPMRKKLIAVLATLVLSIALTSCSDDDDDSCDAMGASRVGLSAMADRPKPRPLDNRPARHAPASRPSASKSTKPGSTGGKVKIDDDIFESCTEATADADG
jgi:hypothetical protein